MSYAQDELRLQQQRRQLREAEKAVGINAKVIGSLQADIAALQNNEDAKPSPKRECSWPKCNCPVVGGVPVCKAEQTN